MLIALVLQIAAAAPDSVPHPAPVLRVPSFSIDQQQDTVRRRRRAVEVSEWYGRRLTIHRTLSYAMLPVFATQYVAGTKLYDAEKNNTSVGSWVKPVHKAGAYTIAGIFGVNTVTGLWNLWDSRHTEQHRWLRISHAVVMLGADAAFAYTGIKLSDEAENSQVKRDEHRRVALYAIGVSTASGVVMKIFNR
jgi:hypothetical protein